MGNQNVANQKLLLLSIFTVIVRIFATFSFVPQQSAQAMHNDTQNITKPEHDMSKKNECFANKHTGRCYVEKYDGKPGQINHTKTMMNPDQHIENSKWPEYCWCAYLKTQIMKYMQNKISKY